MYISIIVNICHEFNNKNNCEVFRAQRGSGSIAEVAKPARLHYHAVHVQKDTPCLSMKIMRNKN
jgi:hypothetical protein